MAWELMNDSEEYRDYEADFQTMNSTGLATLTFVKEKHQAYALKANPEATPENDIETYLDEAIDLSWDDAESIMMGLPVRGGVTC